LSGNRTIDVSAALIFHQGRLLITQRHPDSHLGGLWEFPGGKREADETFESALHREITEELGITIAIERLFEEVTHDYPERSVRIQFFTCRLRAGEARPLDCAGLAWVTPAELDRYEFPAADATLLARLRQTQWP